MGLAAGGRTQGVSAGEICCFGRKLKASTLDVFMLGQLTRSNSAVVSRQSGTRTHSGNVHLGAVFKPIKLHLNSNGDQILTFISKAQPFKLTQLILGCLSLCTAEVCAGSICSYLWSAKADPSVRSQVVSLDGEACPSAWVLLNTLEGMIGTGEPWCKPSQLSLRDSVEEQGADVSE